MALQAFALGGGGGVAAQAPRQAPVTAQVGSGVFNQSAADRSLADLRARSATIYPIYSRIQGDTTLLEKMIASEQFQKKGEAFDADKRVVWEGMCRPFVKHFNFGDGHGDGASTANRGALTNRIFSYHEALGHYHPGTSLLSESHDSLYKENGAPLPMINTHPGRGKPESMPGQFYTGDTAGMANQYLYV